MDLRLSEKVAIVSGGSRGIGRAIALSLVAEGVKVAIAARNAEQLERTTTAINSMSGVEVLGVVTDTNERSSVNQMVELVVQKVGPISILVNCAATPNTSSQAPRWDEVDSETLHREMNTKVMGYVRTIQAAAPYMIASGWGRIINLAGGAARHVGSTIGSIRNAGVVAMTKNFAAELGPHGINVVSVHPGKVLTERSNSVISALAIEQSISTDEACRRIYGQNDLQRPITASEVADIVTFLASPLAVGITGDVVSTGGGTESAIFY